MPRFLALGDSYTIGERVDPDQRWPVQLTALLRADKFLIGDPEIIARTGWTADELDAAISEAAPEGPYQLVSLLIGVNDQYRGLDVEAYRGSLRGLLRRAVDFAGGAPERVIVLSIPDWGVTPFAAGRARDEIAAEIDVFNAVCREEALSAGVHHIDITEASRLRGDEPDFVAADGLHPSGEMYRVWATRSLPIVKKILSDD